MARRFIEYCINDANIGGRGVAGRNATRRCSRGETSDTEVVGGEYSPALRWERLNELTLAALNGIKVPCPLGVHGINGGHHTDAGACQGAERPNITLDVHPHLSDVAHGSVREIEQRHGQPDLVVGVPWGGGAAGRLTPKGGGDELLRRGLPHRAGDSDHLKREAVAPLRRRTAEGDTPLLDTDQRSARRSYRQLNLGQNLSKLCSPLSPLNNNGRRTGAQRLAGMVKAVRSLTREGEEHLTCRGKARIDRAAADRLRAINDQRAAEDAGKFVARCGKRPAHRPCRS